MKNLFFKIGFVAVIALLMLVPLTMVKNLIRERRSNADASRAEVSQSWGGAQTLAGPSLVFYYDQTVKDGDGKPDDTSFGVRMLESVTQYQQTERSVKYAILIILLVFVAGLGVELLGKKEINLVQYTVIGLSLVLFYALVLSFSEFWSFRLAYAVAATMTTAALFGYFRGILHSKEAQLLTALVATVYAVSYMLLQMETYAFLVGTLILFAVLTVIMYLTRNRTVTKEG